ncbi:hypothetical protein AC249_AIPGENE18553 [Exaiptasia diaphana]|nr:hypothetical protein AC249_AIPGENE18553 [Exaiptasia diaphana]
MDSPVTICGKSKRLHIVEQAAPSESSLQFREHRTHNAIKGIPHSVIRFAKRQKKSKQSYENEETSTALNREAAGSQNEIRKEREAHDMSGNDVTGQNINNVLDKLNRSSRFPNPHSPPRSPVLFVSKVQS